MYTLFKSPKHKTFLFVLSLSIVFVFTNATQERYTKDGWLMKNYSLEVKRHVLDDNGKLSNKQIEKAFEETGFYINTTVTYAPDSTFKIFVVEATGCGSVCNSEWYSWVHFNLRGKETIIKPDLNSNGQDTGGFTSIEAIYQLPDKRYLLFESSYGNAAPVAGYHYDHARIISFDAHRMIRHPLKYNGRQSFVGVTSSPREDEDWNPYLRYDTATKMITFMYGQNYGYPSGADIDTIREGRFRYTGGEFLLEKEVITIIDRRSIEER